jgi:tetratricopeptide (TPR) repeat protein
MRLTWRVVGAVLSIAAVASAGVVGQDAARPVAPSKPYEGISLFGTALVTPAAGAASLASYEQARRDFEAARTEDHYIWLGRRTAYLGRYRDAIAIYTEGLQKFPGSYRLYRHRGHRYISIRQFGRAIADFEKAAALAQGKSLEVEPDGAPNKAGIPVSNTHFNIYYHLGLSYFLTRDFGKAEAAYRECLKWSKNDDSVVAVTDWLYMTLRRTGQRAAADAAVASIRRDMALMENGAYLDRVLMFKGTIAQEDFARARDGESVSETAIRDYGMGLVALWGGDAARARALFERQATGGSWASFATIAAEVELADIVRTHPDRRSVASTLNAWTLSWNTYDLDLAARLFTTEPAPSYYSSEKPGRIAGRDALTAHHKGFGFVPGGKASDSRLWLEGLAVEERGDTAFATATWLFDRDVASAASPQRGPVTFVLFKAADGWRIAHAHFANE